MSRASKGTNPNPFFAAGSLPFYVALVFCLPFHWHRPIQAQEKPAGESLFKQKVVPIIQRRCLECHSKQKQEGGISFQNKPDADFEDLVDVDDPLNSRLLEVIRPDEFGHAEMPKKRTALSVEQVNVIEQWIKQGAHWPDAFEMAPLKIDNQWWSLRPIKAAKPPALNSKKIENPIDAFIQRRHQQLGLTAAKPADRRTLIRRVYYDLIGLPPSRKEMDEFVASSDPLAYEKLVDRLLASPGYGERWARHWLDLVHYGDTHGFDKDKLRNNAWPYRDWVIKSLNADIPYRDFVRLQIAGDGLKPESADAITATGMLAAGPFDWVGQIEVANGTLEKKRVRNLDRDDMVATVFNAFASTTAQCARCHDHKFDPVTQVDYYSMQAIFAGMDRADRVLPPNEATAKQIEKLQASLKNFEQQLAGLEMEREKKLSPILAPLRKKQLQLQKSLEKLPGFIDQKRGNQGHSNGFHSQFAKGSEESVTIDFQFDDSKKIQAVILHPARPVDFPDSPGFAFPKRWKLTASSENGDEWLIHDQTANDFANPGDRPVMILVPEPRKRQGVRSLQFKATRLATRNSKDQMFALSLGEVQIVSENRNIAPEAKLAASSSINSGRWHLNHLTDQLTSRNFLVGGNAFPDVAKTIPQRVSIESELSKIQTEIKQIESRTVATIDTQIKKVKTEQPLLKDRIAKLKTERLVFAAATDFKPQGNFVPTRGNQRPVYVLNRGDVRYPDTKKGAVYPGAIESLRSLQMHFFLPTDHRETAGRIALANWMTDPKNPLTWRSIVNRVWQHHFGKGLVSTPNDFGRMGAEPSHPELLDFLATDFRDNGGSLKKLHRLIVTSETYRQSSANDDKNAKVDSSNRFLWRFNRQRLDAEQLRDSILAVANRLNRKMYGPGFRSFGLKDDHSPHFDYRKSDPLAEENRRRSVYRFVVRSVPDPFFESLDCADPSQVVAKRTETNTALQALTLLNNRFTVALAADLAKQIKSTESEVSGQVARCFERILCRKITPTENQIMTRIASEHGLANVCRILINSNEFMFID